MLSSKKEVSEKVFRGAWYNISMIKICEVPNCGKEVLCKGYCSKHYQRWRKYGDPTQVKYGDGPKNLCTVCHKNERYISPGGQKSTKCRPCLNKDRAEWGTKVGRRFQRYGLSKETLEQMFINQLNCCAICKDSFDDVDDHVDHDNSCCSKDQTRQRRSCGGCIRDLLCGSCNQGLGNFKDSIERLEQAILYLQKWNSRK